jgi:hypothetical protein
MRNRSEYTANLYLQNPAARELGQWHRKAPRRGCVPFGKVCSVVCGLIVLAAFLKGLQAF